VRWRWWKRSARLWDVRTGRQLWTAQAAGEKLPARAVAFAPDGKSLASVHGSPNVHRWDAASGKPLGGWSAPKYKLSSVLFSVDGRVVAAAGDDGAVYLWDTTTGKLLDQVERARKRWDPHLGGTVIALSPDGRTLATASISGPIQMWEIASGEAVLSFDPPCNPIDALAFSPDGRSLAAGGDGDFTILVWDLTGQAGNERPTPTGPAQRQLEHLWDDLGDADASRAYRARWRFVAAADQAVAFLGHRLPPIPSADARQIARLIADLESEEFAVREKASRELEKLHEVAEPALREALAGRPGPEAHRRVRELLDQLAPSSGGRLRELRAVAVLESLSTPEARALLRALANGAPEALLTQAAKASLLRLDRRIPINP
jgi:hypothetical protein